MSDIENFTLLVCWMFWHSYKYSWAFGGIWLSYLETVWSFQFLLFKALLDMTRACLVQGSLFFTTEARPFLIIPNFPWIKRFSTLFSTNGHYIQSFLSSEHCSLSLILSVFPQSWVVFSNACNDHYSNEYSKETLCWTSESYVHFPPFQYYALRTVDTLAFPVSYLYLLNSGRPLGSTWIAPFYTTTA